MYIFLFIIVLVIPAHATWEYVKNKIYIQHLEDIQKNHLYQLYLLLGPTHYHIHMGYHVFYHLSHLLYKSAEDH